MGNIKIVVDISSLGTIGSVDIRGQGVNQELGFSSVLETMPL